MGDFCQMSSALPSAKPSLISTSTISVGDFAGGEDIGAGCAHEIVLLDIKEGFAEGKALDIWQKSPIIGYDSRTVGVTSDYARTAGSEVIVITSVCPQTGTEP